MGSKIYSIVTRTMAQTPEAQPRDEAEFGKTPVIMPLFSACAIMLVPLAHRLAEFLYEKPVSPTTT